MLKLEPARYIAQLNPTIPACWLGLFVPELALYLDWQCSISFVDIGALHQVQCTDW